jgi:acyl-CoA hydrolase
MQLQKKAKPNNAICFNFNPLRINPEGIFFGILQAIRPHLNCYLCENYFMEKKAAASKVNMTELVLPNDTNTFGNLMGGRLMYWMDIAAALSAMKHCAAPVVTASVDNISFQNPIKLGNVVHIEATVTRAFNSSMEVHLQVWGEDAVQQYRYKSNEAFLTFVALDPNGKPRPVATVVPETEEEKKHYDGALRRRQVRLILGGKLKPEEAQELKALFIKD